MTKEKKEKAKGVWRIPFGILLFWILWFATAALAAFAGVVGVIIDVILYLFLFGIVGAWMLGFLVMGVVNPVVKFFAGLFGGIGFFIRPYAIMLYGSHKKWILNVFVAIPTFIIAVLCFVAAALLPAFVAAQMPEAAENTNKVVGMWSTMIFVCVGIVSLIYGVLVLLIKKCPECKCVMSKIELETDVNVSKKTKYYTKGQENVGTLSDGRGNSVDVYANVTYEHDGYDDCEVKTYTCDNCGNTEYGMKFHILTEY